MAGKFLGGVLIGGIVGAAIAFQWDGLMKKCPCLNELKEDMGFDSDEGKRGDCQRKPHSKTTRLMARRNRMAN